jgi:hypothetical protein
MVYFQRLSCNSQECLTKVTRELSKNNTCSFWDSNWVIPDNNLEATSAGYINNDHSSCVLHVPLLFAWIRDCNELQLCSGLRATRRFRLQSKCLVSCPLWFLMFWRIGTGSIACSMSSFSTTHNQVALLCVCTTTLNMDVKFNSFFILDTRH